MTQALPKKAAKVKTSPYDVAEHLRTPEEMALSLTFLEVVEQLHRQ